MSGQENFGPKLKTQTVKILEMTESVCCFSKCLSTWEIPELQANSVLTDCKFNIGNYFAELRLATPI